MFVEEATMSAEMQNCLTENATMLSMIFIRDSFLTFQQLNLCVTVEHLKYASIHLITPVAP